MPKNMATYVHTGGVSKAYSRICMTWARVHGDAMETLSCSLETNRLGRNGESASCTWGGNEMCRVHQEATEKVVFIGSQPAWTKQPKQGLAYRSTKETGLLFDCVRSKRGPVHWEGYVIPQNGGNKLVFKCLRSKWGPVHREGSNVPQNGGNGLMLTAYGRNGVLLIGRGVEYHKMEETG